MQNILQLVREWKRLMILKNLPLQQQNRRILLKKSLKIFPTVRICLSMSITLKSKIKVRHLISFQELWKITLMKSREEKHMPITSLPDLVPRDSVLTGLFTDDGVQVQLSKVTEELDRHKGNIWTAIISIRREDAERLGFNTGSRWRDMLRTQTEALAKNLKIPIQNLRWYAAFHNESYHPHVHLIAYSTVENEGYLTQKGVENLRSSFAKDIFQQDLLCIYEKQTQHRDRLRAEARDIVDDLVSKINCEIYVSASIQHKLLELADRLLKISGKKVYGYLKPDVKALVNSILEELANDIRIKKLYDLWYEQNENTIRTYTDEVPDRIPLAQNKEFKSIKNAIIKEALKLNVTEDEAEESENTDEESVSNPFEYEENTSAESVFDSGRGVLYPRYSIKTNRNSVAVSSLYLLRYLCNMIQSQLRFEEKQKVQRTDKKLQQKINDKKQGLGLKQ